MFYNIIIWCIDLKTTLILEMLLTSDKFADDQLLT